MTDKSRKHPKNLESFKRDLRRTGKRLAEAFKLPAEAQLSLTGQFLYRDWAAARDATYGEDDRGRLFRAWDDLSGRDQKAWEGLAGEVRRLCERSYENGRSAKK